MRLSKEWTTREIVLGTLLVAAVLGVLAVVVQFAQVLFTIFLALTLSVALEPAVNRLNGRSLRRPASALLVYGLLLLFVLLLVALIVPLIYSQVSTLLARVPEYYQALRDWLVRSPAALVRALSAQLPARLEDLLASVVLPQTSAFSAAAGVLNTLFDILVVFLLAFYWTLDNDRSLRLLILNLPEERRESTRQLVADFKEKVGAYVRGQTLLCLIVGGMSIAAYVWIGLPYALSLGLVAGVFEALPMIGPVIGLLPALVIAVAVAPEKTWLVATAGLVIQQLENNLLVPRVMDRSVGVSPVVAILSIGAFSLVFGVTGALLAIPTAAVIQVVTDRVVFSNPDLLSPGESLAVSPAPARQLAATGRPVPGPAGLERPAGGDSRRSAPDAAGAAGSAGEAAVMPARDRLGRLSLELQELTVDIRKQQREKDGLADPTVDEIEDELESAAERLYELVSRRSSEQASEQA
ncbi:MAG: AI-2E family transporter [Chloroflexota bacterium]